MPGTDAALGTAVSTHDLAVGYGGRAVVAGIDIDIGTGKTLAIVGTNGSGKSTLLKTLAGLLPTVGGRAAVLGDRPGVQPARIAYVSQHQTVNEALPIRVVDVVGMGRFPHLSLWRSMGKRDRDLVNESMQRMGVDGIGTHPLRELSGGQRQRVYLAQALARRPDLFLLDEPVSGIDAGGRDRYRKVFAEERERGAAIVLATHDFGESGRADTVLLLARRVVAVGSPAHVLTRANLLEAFGVTITEIGGHAFAHDPHHHSH